MRGAGRFSVVYRTGSRRRVGGVTVIRADGGDGPAAVGFVAGRRVGNAVARNRAKRRLRSAARAARLEEGVAYVVIASPEVLTVEFPTLVAWLRRAVSALRGGEERHDD